MEVRSNASGSRSITIVEFYTFKILLTMECDSSSSSLSVWGEQPIAIYHNPPAVQVVPPCFRCSNDFLTGCRAPFPPVCPQGRVHWYTHTWCGWSSDWFSSWETAKEHKVSFQTRFLSVVILTLMYFTDCWHTIKLSHPSFSVMYLLWNVNVLFVHMFVRACRWFYAFKCIRGALILHELLLIGTCCVITLWCQFFATLNVSYPVASIWYFLKHTETCLLQQQGNTFCP